MEEGYRFALTKMSIGLYLVVSTSHTLRKAKFYHDIPKVKNYLLTLTILHKLLYLESGQYLYETLLSYTKMLFYLAYNLSIIHQSKNLMFCACIHNIDNTFCDAVDATFS